MSYDYACSHPAYQEVKQNIEWVPIKGLEGIYEVNILGQVKRLPYNKLVKGNGLQPCPERILKYSDDSHGYWKYDLCYNSKKIHYKMHQLIAIHFIPNPENKKTVNHKNGIKKDNSIENLEWNTYAENNIHKFQVLGYKHFGVKDIKNSRSLSIYSIDEYGEIKLYNCISTAANEVGATSGNLVKTLKGKHKTCKKKRWFYSAIKSETIQQKLF